MSEGFKFQASVKDADGDMVNVRADSPEELDAYLSNFPVAAYAQFKANVRGGQALGAVVQPAPVQQQAPAPQQGWGQPAVPAPAPAVEPTWAAQPVAAPAAPPQQNTSKFAGPPHPEGKTCEHPACSKVLEAKKTSAGADTWRCPDWRWSNGNPNGHTSVFVK